MSETSKIRKEVLEYCNGLGIDLGCGGDKVVEGCIGFDMPIPYTSVGNDAIDVKGDARKLPYSENYFDFVYSSHLLEDFPNTLEILREWYRVLKPGGHLILYLPNEKVYRKHCDDTGQVYNLSHSIEEMSLEYIKNIYLDDCFDVEVVKEIELHEIYSFLIVVRKKVVGFHTGDLGDVVYCLPSFKAKGVEKIILNPDKAYGTKMTRPVCKVIKPLLESQGYEVEIKEYPGYPKENNVPYINFDAFRFTHQNIQFSHLAISHARGVGADIDLTKPFINIDDPLHEGNIVINRSYRYRASNFNFDWKELLSDIDEEIIFVGLPEECFNFVKDNELDNIRHYHTNDLYQLARVIAGCKVFIGNQSCPYAIAEGLKVNRILEECNWTPNCTPQTGNGLPVRNAKELQQAKYYLKLWLK